MVTQRDCCKHDERRERYIYRANTNEIKGLKTKGWEEGEGDEKERAETEVGEYSTNRKKRGKK